MTLDDVIFHHESIQANDPDWLISLREQGIDALKAHGFPARKTEAWKYTRCSELLKPDYSMVIPPITMAAKQIAPYLLTQGNYLVFVDGVYQPNVSKSQPTICPLSQALTTRSSLIEQHLGSVANLNEAGFSGLNTAMLRDGAFVHINENIAEPIQLLFFSTSRISFVSHLRNLIITEPNTQASIIESYIGLDDTACYFNNVVTETLMGDNSQLDYYKLQQESAAGFHVNSHFIRQHTQSQLRHLNVDIGAKLARNGLQSTIHGEASDCQFNGLYLIRDEQHIDNHTHLHHQAPNTTSAQYYKGIMADKGHGVFNGQVTVDPQAQKINAEQQNRNLILSKNAAIDTKPELQIHADDVKCAHGATIGQLDKTALFYLQSRGIDSITAKAMLTYGFAKELLVDIKHPPIKTYLEQQLQNWLELIDA